MPEKYHPVIGIDLGTTFSAVAVYDTENQEAKVLPNPESQETNGLTTPSVIGFDRNTGRVHVGWPVKRNLAYARRGGPDWREEDEPVLEIKREMGELFSPQTLAQFGSRAAGKVGEPVRVKFAGRDLLPQELSALTLMKMKRVAEAELGTEIRDAVITVPAYFKANQKKATEDAALLAGLYPRQLIPEPTAAAICYGVDKYEAMRKNYLVYDLGGGTFDVSIISVQGSRIDVIATSGDPRLGGGDFDDEVAKWAAQRLLENHNLDVRNDARMMAILKAYAEKAKIQLSDFDTATMPLGHLRPEDPVTLTIGRSTFESLIKGLLNKSLSYVDTALGLAARNGRTREQIDAILLVGGSSKIPLVRSELLAYFRRGEDFIRSDLNADLVVAKGAAIVGLQYTASPPPFDVKSRPSLKADNPDAAEVVQTQLITEHTLGIGALGERNEYRFVPIVRVGELLPAERKRDGFSNPGPVTELPVEIFQGENDDPRKNTLLGRLMITDLEPAQKDHHKFEVTFSLNESGLLSTTVKHLNTGREYPAKFDQKTAIGGEDALITQRKILLEMFPPDAPAGPWTTTAPRIEPPTVLPPVLAPPLSFAPPGGMPVAAPPNPYATMPGAPPRNPYADTPAPPPAWPGTPTATAPAPTPAPAASGASTGAVDLVPIQVPIPDKLQSLMRMAKKTIDEKAPPRLVKAYNGMAKLINAGAPGQDLDDMKSQLQDIYLDSM
jgi:molecular chaperone DnaK (HSP70)